MNLFKVLNFKNISIIAACFCMSGMAAFSADNVLQAIQVNGVKDSYNIILKSDDVAEIHKTVQAPNKMILNLKGIRASKTINTIYNNTSSVDSVVVEPNGEDSVKISVQADNVGSAEVKFDTLKTPLGVLEKSQKQTKAADELVLNKPTSSYRPVYDNSSDEEEAGLSLTSVSKSIIRHAKKIVKSGKLSWVVTLGLFLLLVLNTLKTLIKGQDSDIKVGLTQSLKDREIDMYKGSRGVNAEISGASINANRNTPQPQSPAGAYGLRAYQNGTKSPYATAEIQRPRPNVAPQAAPSTANLQAAAKTFSARPAMQSTIQPTGTNSALNSNINNIKPKSTNIDSMKFLESMTKIYEKNGRSDLAKGLKANMKKAKVNLA